MKITFLFLQSQKDCFKIFAAFHVIVAMGYKNNRNLENAVFCFELYFSHGNSVTDINKMI